MSTKEFGCFFCDGKSANYDDNCPKCGKPINISSELLKFEEEEYSARQILGRGFYGWTVKVEDPYQEFAMKITPYFRLPQGPMEDREARALAKCSPHRNIARFVRQIPIKLHLFGKDVPVVCLIFEFIENARPLSKIIADDNFNPTQSDVVDILTGITSGLARMHSNELWHDDLHDDNVLVRTVEPDENLSEHYEAKLIDFGSAKPMIPGQPESSDRSDYMYLCKHIFGIVSRFEYGSRYSLSPVDRTFVSQLRDLAHRLSDRNISRRNLTPREVFDEIRDILGKTVSGNDFLSFDEMKEKEKVSFTEPLANNNAITLAPQDIALLFRDSLGWQDRIEKSEPVLIVGPRGCGKTMLLRFLSISSQVRPHKNEVTKEDVANRLNNAKHIGFLVSCGRLRTPFLRSPYSKLEKKYPELAHDFCREFINSHFLYEVLRTFSWLHAEGLASVSFDDLNQLNSKVQSLIGKKEHEYHNGQKLSETIESISRRIIELSNLSKPSEYSPTNLCRDDVLVSLAQTAKSLFWSRSKEIWFLLDDYSPTVFPELAIISYNPVIFRLSSEVKIKISSEGDGPIFVDSLGRKYKEGRELTRINIGEIYFQNSEKDCLEFFEQILSARFEETKKGTLDDLKIMLGKHECDRNFGKYICEQDKPGNTRFYGFSLLCRLCSGDVSYIILLMHLLSKGRWDQQKLTPHEQDTITKRFAQRQLADLRSISGYGPTLHEFAERLGSLLKQYLLESKEKETSDERLRIEIEGNNELSQDAKIIENELLRHSVLIPGGYGKSKAGLPTRRLFFRRLFAPCFPFSPTRKGCIPLEWSEYEKWLKDPSVIWEKPITDDNNFGPLFSGVK